MIRATAGAAAAGAGGGAAATYQSVIDSLGPVNEIRLDEASGDFLTQSGGFAFEVIAGTFTRQVAALGGAVGTTAATAGRLQEQATGLQAGLGLDDRTYSIVFQVRGNNDVGDPIYSSSGERQYRISTSANTTSWYTGSSILGPQMNTNQSIYTGEYWHVVAIVSDLSGSRSALYIDGMECDTETSATAASQLPMTSVERLALFADWGGGQEFLGSMAGLAFFDKALTLEELESIQAACDGPRKGTALIVRDNQKLTGDEFNMGQGLRANGWQVRTVRQSATEVLTTDGIADVAIIKNDSLIAAAKYDGQGANSLPIVHMDRDQWVDNDWMTGTTTVHTSTQIRYDAATPFAWPGQTSGTDVACYDDNSAFVSTVGLTGVADVVCSVAGGGGAPIVFAIDAGETVLNSTVQTARVVGFGFNDGDFNDNDVTAAGHALLDAACAWAAGL